MKPNPTQGYASHRLTDLNKPEVIFDSHWRELNSYERKPLLENLIENPTERDYKVAATITQWLGSHVGQCYLRDVLLELKDQGISHRITD